jgi:hypothetical protein
VKYEKIGKKEEKRLWEKYAPQYSSALHDKRLTALLADLDAIKAGVDTLLADDHDQPIFREYLLQMARKSLKKHIETIELFLGTVE